MNWLVKKLKVKVPFDENKLYASEILSILLQTEPGNRKMFGELNAIDNLLQQVSQGVGILMKFIQVFDYSWPTTSDTTQPSVRKWR